MSGFLSQSIPPPAPPTKPHVCMSALYISVCLPALQIGSSVSRFQIPYMCVNIRSLSLSDSLQSARQLLWVRPRHGSWPGFLPFSWLSSIPRTHCHIILMRSSVDGNLGCLQAPITVSSAAVTIGTPVPFWTVLFLGMHAQEWGCQSYTSFIFSFLKNLHATLRRGKP